MDAARRTQEYDRLARCVTGAESDWALVDARVAAMASYVAPSIASDPPMSVQRGLYRLLAEQADEGLPALRRGQKRCRSVDILSFHSALASARDAYVGLLAGETERLTQTVADGSRAFAGSENIAVLRARARVLLAEAARDARPGEATRPLMTRR